LPARQLEKEVQREKALAEAEGRTEERRRNKDIYREYARGAGGAVLGVL
jgi:hypothetical protein